MRFYKPHTKFYCGVDMHSRIIYVCIIGEDKKIIVHKKINNQDTKQLLETLEPYKDSIVVLCESAFAWYWLADFYLKRAFTDAALHVSRFNPEIEKYFTKMQSKKGKMKAYCILGNKLARVVYHMLHTEKVFDMKRFLTGN